jgi:hypothetical protein
MPGLQPTWQRIVARRSSSGASTELAKRGGEDEWIVSRLQLISCSEVIPTHAAADYRASQIGRPGKLAWLAPQSSLAKAFAEMSAG